jgi:2-polyprenyl-3-methyl-5-hydroxy-6-metoxy-1,4-benzoquinol methylase
MKNDSFQPISVKSPEQNHILFKLRCLIDLQLKTIVDFLKNDLMSLPKGKLIDIGAGESPWKYWLKKEHEYTGIDIRYSNEFGMSKRGSDILLYDGKIMPLEDNSFDSAICIEVLEHAEDPELLLMEISRILKSNSKLLLSVPWSARRHHIPHDYHRFTKERLKILFEKSNFKDIEILERGNDYCVVTNKLIVITIRNFKGVNAKNILIKVPLVLIFGFFSILLLLISHISLLFKNNSKDDPLGYYCRATKK